MPWIKCVRVTLPSTFIRCGVPSISTGPSKGTFTGHWWITLNGNVAGRMRFGLWGLDVDTQKRIRRPTVDLYAAICKENGLSSEMVQKYCPEVFNKIFPD